MDLTDLIPPSLPLPLLLLGGLLLALLCALATRRRARRAPAAPEEPSEPTLRPAAPYLPYVRTHQLLTRTERAFLATIQLVAPAGWLVFPQVALAALVHVEQRARSNPEHLSRLQGRYVDFVLCEPQTTTPRLVIELEDAASADARWRRDQLVEGVLRKVGMPVMYVQVGERYDEDALRMRLRGYLGPAGGPATGVTQTAVPTLPRAPAAPRRAVRRPAPPSLVGADTIHLRTCQACHSELGGGEQYCPHCGAPALVG